MSNIEEARQNLDEALIDADINAEQTKQITDKIEYLIEEKIASIMTGGN